MAAESRSSGLPRDVSILCENDDYLVVSKPFDLVINDDANYNASSLSPPRPSLAALLAVRFPQLVDASVPHHFRFVHRLDYSTSGAICLALNADAAKRATKQFEARRIVKHYLALLRGHMLEKRDGLVIGPIVVNANIGQDTRPGYEHKMTTPRMSQDTGLAERDLKGVDSAIDSESLPVSSSHFRHAETHFHVISRGYLKNPLIVNEDDLYDRGQPVTKVLISLKTGRRHQIRVHAKEVGHPIVGDFTYDDDRRSARMYLHSCRLFVPWTGGRGRTNRRKVAETFDEGEAERKPLVDVVDMVAFESQLFDIWTECVTVQSAKELSDEILHREMLTRDCA